MMTLPDIITELETLALRQQEVTDTADSLHAALTYFFEQLQTRPTWSLAELTQLQDTTLVSRSMTALHIALTH